MKVSCFVRKPMCALSSNKFPGFPQHASGNKVLCAGVVNAPNCRVRFQADSFRDRPGSCKNIFPAGDFGFLCHPAGGSCVWLQSAVPCRVFLVFLEFKFDFFQQFGACWVVQRRVCLAPHFRLHNFRVAVQAAYKIQPAAVRGVAFKYFFRPWPCTCPAGRRARRLVWL